MTERIWAIRDQIEDLVGTIPFDAAPWSPVLPERLAGVIDHTLLKAEATSEQVAALCGEAREFRFASVCIQPVYVPFAVRELEGSGVPVCTVIGFPLGATSTEAKAAEARLAVRDGSRELDMVLSIGRLRAGDWRAVRDDVRAVVEAVRPSATVKVILEACLLSEEEKIAACLLSVAAGAAYVKTSTGFAKGGATVEDVALMRAVVGAGVGVKAAGGIRTRQDAEAMLRAGASRLGCSASVAIVGGG